jgi:pyrroline-5-carboxylate reductase
VKKHAVIILGGGAMGSAIAQGLSSQEGKEFKVTVLEINDNKQQLAEAETVVIAVKPQGSKQALEEVALHSLKDAVILSVMTGIEVKTIQEQCKRQNVVRSVPNLAAAMQKSISAYYAAPECTQQAVECCEIMLKKLGTVICLKHEALLNTATALIGTGPGVLAKFAEEMLMVAEQSGFERSDAVNLVAGVFAGTGALLQKEGETPLALAKRVTSPNGTTAAAISVLEEKKVGGLIRESFEAAIRRAEELSKR